MSFARPLIVLLAAGLLYGGVSAVSILTGLHHYEWLVLGLRIFILLPALLYLLRFRSGSESKVYRWEESSGLWKRSVGLWICLLGFVACALLVSYHICQGITFADESSYRFQAEVFAGLKAVANAPPGATATPANTPLPLAYKHLILFHSGWFSKYPLGWPAVLALPEKLGIEWIATPLLGGLLLFLVGKIAREAFGATTVLPAVWIAALSPYCLAQCVGILSHALCAVLIAAACWFCLRGIARQSLSQFSLMFVMLVLGFHVRPFTAFVAAVVLGLASLWYCRRNQRLIRRLAIVATGFAVLAVVSILLYNRAYTGNPWISPYSLYDQQVVPSTSPSVILQNLLWTRRLSAQATLLYAFPFVFTLGAYGFWKERRSPAANVLACLFPAVVAGHSVFIFTSSPIVGERYYFEAYCTVAVLAARGLECLILKWRSSKQAVILTLLTLTGIQVVFTGVAIRQLASVGQPYREVMRLAEQYRDCRCAVFLKTTNTDSFASESMNLNTPAWKSAVVFYLNDPGPAQRPMWASLFGWHSWAVIGYDEQTKMARLELYHPAKGATRKD